MWGKLTRVFWSRNAKSAETIEEAFHPGSVGRGERQDSADSDCRLPTRQKTAS